MTTPTAAAIYTRISSDTEGTGKGVERQEEDCRRLAADLGWPVHDVYEDNDFSAYTGKPRPAYERMLDDITEGTVDAVIVYNLDRLTRRPAEFEEFNDIVRRAGVTNVRFVTGDMDLGTDDGLLIGRIQAAVAADESAKKSRRIRRKMDQVAAEGRPHGGSVRPFGFEDDKITHRPDEVELIRRFLARFLAGESCRSLASWANQQPIRPSGGDEWRSPVISRLLSSPRTAGLREHRGEIIGPAIWVPVISIKERDEVLAVQEQKKVTGRRTPRRYLLSGLLRCGHCDTRLYSAARKTTRRYVCMAGPDHKGCG
jgi:DNA invertase Pin-like site-specific DNA recombinase